MPLPHQPHRPVPAVELLTSRPITVEDAVRGLEVAVQMAGETQDAGPGTGAVNYKHLPAILGSLRDDWEPLQVSGRPADCFAEVHGRLETHLHPHYMGEKLQAGLLGAAGVLLLRFVHVLGCVPIGFTHLSPVGSQAAIVGESPYLHFLLEFHAIGFVPKERQWLLGRVSEDQTKMGVNVLVLNCIHFQVSKHRLTPNSFAFDSERGQWHARAGGDGGEEAVDHHCGPVWVQVQNVRAGNLAPLSLAGGMDWPPVGGAAVGQSSRAEASLAAGGSGGAAAAAANGHGSADAAPRGAKRAKEAADAGGAAPAAAAVAPAAKGRAAASAPKKKKKSAAGAFGKKGAGL